jgi:hypothetical protein
MAPDRSRLIAPEVMVAPLIWLCSNGSDAINGQRFIAMRWDDSLPPAGSNSAVKRSCRNACGERAGSRNIQSISYCRARRTAASPGS